jgi:aryl-alcohol dehydrogenase-like predicted oxidoreductase
MARGAPPCARAQLGTTVDALALAAVLAQPFSPVCLSGATTAAQLGSNFAAIELARRLPAGLAASLLGALAQPAEEYWRERSLLSWN